jgi:hypothetical protein
VEKESAMYFIKIRKRNEREREREKRQIVNFGSKAFYCHKQYTTQDER